MVHPSLLHPAVQQPRIPHGLPSLLPDWLEAVGDRRPPGWLSREYGHFWREVDAADAGHSGLHQAGGPGLQKLGGKNDGIGKVYLRQTARLGKSVFI